MVEKAVSDSQALLFVLSGPSGVGKDTILSELLKTDLKIRKCVTYTTRSPRPTEIDGVDYKFITLEEFNRLKEEGAFLEWAEVGGNFYATPKDFVEEKLKNGEDVILKIDVQGAMRVKELFPNAILIFIAPPSLEELRQRMEKRGTPPEEIERRLKIAEREMDMAKHYQFLIVNNELLETVEKVYRIIKEAQNKRDAGRESAAK
ncbi:guanylate kinase [bacterium]|nr:guanylate kinase [bacterium]